MAIPGTPPNPAEYHAYADRIRQLVDEPSILANLPAQKMVILVRTRLNLAGYFMDRFTSEDAKAVRQGETFLMGVMLMALESKVRPVADQNQTFSIQDDSPAAAAMAEHMQDKRAIWDFLAGATRLLKGLFHKPGDKSSVDPEVRPILTASGVDPASIDLLVGKTQAPDH